MPEPTIASISRITPSELHTLILSQSHPQSIDEPPTTTTTTTILPTSSPSIPTTTTPLTAQITTTPTLAIIDVRGADHIGGHIRSSHHVPSDTLDHALPELVRRLKDKKTVVFHCALSQVRGPGAALRYLRERRRVLGAEEREAGQEIKVLEGGFVEWQGLYGKDERVTEGYVEDIWREGYWM